MNKGNGMKSKQSANPDEDTVNSERRCVDHLFYDGPLDDSSSTVWQT